jgi:hypothetical protein
VTYWIHCGKCRRGRGLSFVTINWFPALSSTKNDVLAVIQTG